MYQYKVYYDYCIDGVWKYNNIFHETFDSKTCHKKAEWYCEKYLCSDLSIDSFRINKVTCD